MLDVALEEQAIGVSGMTNRFEENFSCGNNETFFVFAATKVFFSKRESFAVIAAKQFVLLQINFFYVKFYLARFVATLK